METNQVFIVRTKNSNAVLSVHSTFNKALEAVDYYRNHHSTWLFEIMSPYSLDELWEG